MIMLGLHDGHNATAALLVDGVVTAMVSEERLTYVKNEMGYPVNAINECLRIAGVNKSKIDKVVFSTLNLPLSYMRIKRELNFSIRDWLDEQELHWKPLLFENKINKKYLDDLISSRKFDCTQYYDFTGIPTHLTTEENRNHLRRLRIAAVQSSIGLSEEAILEVDHHTGHQYYAYFASPFRGKPTLVFTNDAGGDQTNATISIVENDSIKEIKRNNCTDLGRVYRYITLNLGMKMNEHEFKVMGLAPYSSKYETRKTDKVFKNVFHVPDDLVEYKNKPKDLFFHFRDNLADCRFDGMASGVQEMVEEVGKEWFSKVVRKYGISRVVFSGGVSMNVKLNKVVCELDEVKEFYCAASGGDESLAIGAAYYAYRTIANKVPSHIRNNYLGNSGDRNEMLKVLSSMKVATIKTGATNDDVAKLLSENLVIGRFAGRMEFGARSLGNRSILANSANQGMVRKINEKIKFRDFWMPFAPSIIEPYAKQYLVNPKNILGDHMTHSYDVTPAGKAALVAAMHPADETVRAHIVTKEINPDYYDLIERFSKITGHGCVLNTSFNLHGYPIVCKPEHLVHVFENSQLDGMIVEDILVLRK
jgi:carbamoyltransferase